MGDSGNVDSWGNVGLEESTAGHSHIYTSGELNCSGIARALKYCYSFSGILNVFSKFFSWRRSVFTLSILKVTQTLFVRQFTVTKVIDISSAPTLDKCSPWSDGFLCCDTESLDTDQLDFPISNFSYMLTVPFLTNKVHLLGWSASAPQDLQVAQYERQLLTKPFVNAVYTYNTYTERPSGPYKLVQFHLGKLFYTT